nr:coat protein [Rhizoctonia solani partitivirus A14]
MPFNLSFKRKGTNSDHKFKQPEVKVPGTLSLEAKGKQKDDQALDDAVKHEMKAPTDEQTDENKQKTTEPVPKPDRVESREVARPSKTPKDGQQFFWNKYVTFKMSDVEHKTTSKFLPNGLALERLIIDTLNVVGETVWMEKNRPTFNPYAAATGLCYLYYIQILRACFKAGKLKTEDSSALNRLFRVVSEDSIKIPGPFVPYFENIAATELKDAKYEWIVPKFPDLREATSFDNLITHANTRDVLMTAPNIPAMLSILAQFGMMETDEFDARFGDERTFTPVELNRNAAADTTRFANIDVRMNNADWANNADTGNVLQHCGVRIPMMFYNDQGKAVLRDMKRSEFFGEPNDTGLTGVDLCFSSTDAHQIRGVNLLQTKSFAKIENFLFLEKNKNPAWTNYLWKHVNFVAEHFSSSTTLKSINQTQGMETAVLAKLKTRTATAGRYLYADRHMGKAGSSALTYYDNEIVRNLTGSFKTFRGDVDRAAELDAFAFAINALPPIHGVTETQYREGEFFTDPGQGSTIRELGFYEDTSRGTVPMYPGYELDVIRPQYEIKTK